MNTYNKYFNDAWEYLSKFHENARLPGGISLDLTKKPKLTKIDWIHYIQAITTILTIGQREYFIHLHLDGKGRTLYWYVPNRVSIGKG